MPEASATSDALKQQIEDTHQGFIAAMDDDFNTASALGHLFDFVRAINNARDSGLDAAGLEDAQSLLLELTGVLGLQLEKQASIKAGEAAPFVDLLVAIRTELREPEIVGTIRPDSRPACRTKYHSGR